MKTISKFFTGLFIAGSLVLGLTAPANAQRGGRAGGFSRVRFSAHTAFPVTHFTTFYHPYVYPHIGVVVHKLPAKYYVFLWGPTQYYYCDGIFYGMCADGSYQIVTPPVGAEVPSLPIGAQIITIDGNPYYEYNGVYYQSTIKPDGKITYVVAGKDGVLNTQAQTDPGLPLVGDMTDRLPANCHKVTLSGKAYWVTPDGVYLEEVKKNGKPRYRVVLVPEQKDSSSPSAKSTL